MSLFAEKRHSSFDSNSLGSNSFRRDGDPRLGSRSLFNYKSERHTLPTTTRLFGATLISGRIFDHVDSIVHELLDSFDRPSRRHRSNSWDSDSIGRATRQNGSATEYIIPITIETTCGKIRSIPPSSSKSQKEEPKVVKCFPSKPEKETNFLDCDDTASRQDRAQRFIQIPIVRESCQNKLSEHLPRPSVTPSANIPSISTLLTPGSRSTSSAHHGSGHESRSTASAQDSDRYCGQSSTKPTPRKRFATSVIDPELRFVKIEEKLKEEETTISRGKPRQHFYDDRPADLSTNPSQFGQTPFTDSSSSLSTPEVSSCRSDVRSDVRRAEDKRVERENNQAVEQADRQRQCSSPGLADVTPTPTYPVYDLLKPRLASTGRVVDYIRGDGNCFFRALSKEMYGTEDYHAEWREAVCDVIRAHPHVFSQYVDESSVSKHVSSMRQLGTWASSCEIYGAATLLWRDVYVLAPASYEENAEYYWMLFSPRCLSRSRRGSSASVMAGEDEWGEEGGHPCYVTLCHTNGNHYDRITSSDSCCNCQLAPPCLNGLAVLMDIVQSPDEEEEDSWSS